MSKPVKKYLFTIQRKHTISNEFVIGTFYAIQLPFNSEDKECDVPKIAAQFAPKLARELESALFCINMQARYNPQVIGPLLVNWTEEEALTRELLEDYINAMEVSQLQQFVQEAKLKI